MVVSTKNSARMCQGGFRVCDLGTVQDSDSALANALTMEDLLNSFGVSPISQRSSMAEVAKIT